MSRSCYKTFCLCEIISYIKLFSTSREISDKGFINSGNPLMQRIEKLYLGSSGNYIVDGGRDPEYPGFAIRGVSNVFKKNMFKFAKLDQIPDEHVDSILKELKND